MSRTILCAKLQKPAPGLDKPPYPGPIGKQIFEHISAEAWQAWLNHQTMLINEYRLNLTDQSARDFLKTEMQNFLFGQGSDKPGGYTEPKEK
jgi:Fe-S cluster biosynthesis and repair protein YggX